MSSIHVEHISKSYHFYTHQGILKRTRKTVQAVEDVSFDVAPGEIMGLIGANGAGKTTMIKMAAGVLLPDGGTVSIDGEDPFDRSRAYRRKVAIVLGQKGKLHPDMSILETASVYGAMYGLGEAETTARILRIAEMLALTEDMLRKQSRALSLGQRMKGEICICFLNEPSIVFLDEPTLGLDYASTGMIRAFLTDYCRAHRAAMILTSHDLDDIAQTCGKLLIMNAGHCIYYGSIADLPKQFTGNTTIQCRLPDPSAQSRLRAQLPAASVSGAEVRIACNAGEVDAILNLLFRLGEVQALKIEEVSFAEMVGSMLKHE